MFGPRLYALLSKLGYEGTDALDPDSFEWLFKISKDCSLEFSFTLYNNIYIMKIYVN